MNLRGTITTAHLTSPTTTDEPLEQLTPRPHAQRRLSIDEFLTGRDQLGEEPCQGRCCTFEDMRIFSELKEMGGELRKRFTCGNLHELG